MFEVDWRHCADRRNLLVVTVPSLCRRTAPGIERVEALECQIVRNAIEISGGMMHSKAKAGRRQCGEGCLGAGWVKLRVKKKNVQLWQSVRQERVRFASAIDRQAASHFKACLL